MIVSLVKIDCSKIIGWTSFHDEFQRVFGFPNFYGRNMNAWIDCMSSLADPDHGMTQIHCEKGKVITLELSNVENFKTNYRDYFDTIVECSAFVNWRLIDRGDPPVLALAFYD